MFAGPYAISICLWRRPLERVRHDGKISLAARYVGVSKGIVSAANGMLPGTYIFLVPMMRHPTREWRLLKSSGVLPELVEKSSTLPPVCRVIVHNFRLICTYWNLSLLYCLLLLISHAGIG